MLRRWGLVGVAVLVVSACWGPPSPPSPVSALSASATTTSVTLTWTNPTDSYWGVVVHRVHGATPPTEPLEGTFLADVRDGTSYTDTGLAPGTTYSYAVTVYGADGYYSPVTTVVVATAADPLALPLGSPLSYFGGDTSQTGSVSPNPIPADRSPGFWAMVYGPGQYAANGDAFSARCTSQFNCGSVQNQQYRDLADPNRGYWYTVSVPAGVTGSVDINVFDASYNHDSATRIMDTTEGSGAPDFETEFRVFEQTNPADFEAREELFTARAAPTRPTVAAGGSCARRPRSTGPGPSCAPSPTSSPATGTSSTCAPTASAPPTRPATTATPSRSSPTGTATPTPARASLPMPT